MLRCLIWVQLRRRLCIACQSRHCRCFTPLNNGWCSSCQAQDRHRPQLQQHQGQPWQHALATQTLHPEPSKPLRSTCGPEASPCRPSHPLKEAQSASVAASVSASTQGDVDMQAGESSAESASAPPSVPQVEKKRKKRKTKGRKAKKRKKKTPLGDAHVERTDSSAGWLLTCKCEPVSWFRV